MNAFSSFFVSFCTLGMIIFHIQANNQVLTRYLDATQQQTFSNQQSSNSPIFQTVRNQGSRAQRQGHTQASERSSQHHSFHGASTSSTGRIDHDNSGHYYQNAGTAQQAKWVRYEPYDPANPQRFSGIFEQPQELDRSTQMPQAGNESDFQTQRRYDHDQQTANRRDHNYKGRRHSGKNVYVNAVPNNWMLHGIENVVAHFHHFGCQVNDEQRMKLLPNRGHGTVGSMMILFEHDIQASQFIECVNAIKEKLDVNQQKVFVTAKFAMKNNMVDSGLYTKSLTGVYCNIDQNCNEVETILKEALVICRIAKSIHEIKFQAPCVPEYTFRFNYKVASKELRDEALACLIKRDDICTSVGTW